MKEILLAIIIPQLFLVTVYYAIHRSKRAAGQGSRQGSADSARVFEILRLVYLDMNRQHVAAVGPWISSALEHRCGDPAVALTAVRWTLRDLQKTPTGEGVGYVPGLEFRFDLSGLLAAERELEEMKEGRA